MLIDAQLAVSTNQAVTTTAVSTNAIDTGGSNPVRNVGWGEEMRMIVTTSVTFTGGTSIQAELVSADDAALTTNVTSMLAGPVVPVAQAVAGGTPLLDAVLPTNTRRFIGVRYNVVGTMTAGQASAALVHDTDRQRYYANGYPNAY